MRDASGVSDLAKIKAEAETQMRLEMEKMILEKDMGYEEADRIRRAMEEQSVELELQLEEARLDRLARDDTERKLREMEGKLIHGVDALELRNQELQEIALAQEQQLELDARGNTEAQIKIDQLEELHTKKKNEFYVKKESVADVTKKLKKTFARYQGAKADLEAHARTLRLEKEDMVESINLLRRQLLLKDTLIDAFCPKDTAKKGTAMGLGTQIPPTVYVPFVTVYCLLHTAQVHFLRIQYTHTLADSRLKTDFFRSRSQWKSSRRGRTRPSGGFWRGSAGVPREGTERRRAMFLKILTHGSLTELRVWIASR